MFTPRSLAGDGSNLPAGEVTDDTQMALCIGQSIVERGAFDPEDIASRFVDWYHSNPPDIGNTTRMSLQYLAGGVPWDQAGQRTHQQMRPRDASNGSIMRCAPVALWARSNPALNAQHSADSSRITHANPLAVDSCVSQNAAIAALLDDPSRDSLAVAIGAATLPEVRVALERVPDQKVESIDASGYVLATLQSAFWAVWAHETFEEAVIAAVNLGQDADTTGAVAGALAGAKWGYQAIPSRWREALLGHDQFVKLADDLYSLSSGDV